MPISQMDDLLQLMDEWAIDNYDCGVTKIKHEGDVASCAWINKGNMSSHFTLQYVEVYANGCALVKLQAPGMTVVMEAIPSAIAAILYAT